MERDGDRTRDVQLGRPNRLSVVAARVESLPKVAKLWCRRNIARRLPISRADPADEWNARRRVHVVAKTVQLGHQAAPEGWPPALLQDRPGRDPPDAHSAAGG